MKSIFRNVANMMTLLTLAACGGSTTSTAQSHQPLTDEQYRAQALSYVKANPCVESATLVGETLEIILAARQVIRDCVKVLPLMPPFIEIQSVDGNTISAQLSTKGPIDLALHLVNGTGVQNPCFANAELVDDGFILSLRAEAADTTECERLLRLSKEVWENAYMVTDTKMHVGFRLKNISCVNVEKGLKLDLYKDLNFSEDRSANLNLADYAELSSGDAATGVQVLDHCETRAALVEGQMMGLPLNTTVVDASCATESGSSIIKMSFLPQFPNITSTLTVDGIEEEIECNFNGMR